MRGLCILMCESQQNTGDESRPPEQSAEQSRQDQSQLNEQAREQLEQLREQAQQARRRPRPVPACLSSAAPGCEKAASQGAPAVADGGVVATTAARHSYVHPWTPHPSPAARTPG